MMYNVTDIEFDLDDDYDMTEEDKVKFNHQLELLEFMIQEFEYQDDEERALIEGIEAQIYDVKEQDLVRVMDILKAQAKQPKAEW